MRINFILTVVRTNKSNSVLKNKTCQIEIAKFNVLR
jgi:hypothetical protein